MSLGTETTSLRTALRRLRQSWRELAVTVSEDRPGDLAAADRMSERVTDNLGDIEAALAALDGKGHGGLVDAATALRRLHERYERQRGYAETVLLQRALAPHGNGWQSWRQAVDAGLDRCAEPLSTAEEALLRCWREVLEQSSIPTVRVTTSR